MTKSNFTNLSQKASRKIGSALMQVALLAGCVSSGGSAMAYSHYAGRRGNYSGRRNQSYLVDQGLGVFSHDLLTNKMPLRLRNESDFYPADAEIIKGSRIRELVIVDQNIKDYHLLSKIAKPGMEVVELPKDAEGLKFLLAILSRYKDLSAVHLFSHASAGQLQLGNELVNIRDLQNSNTAFDIINKAIKPGGDLLLYGCELGKGQQGDNFLEIIKGNTHVDVAASNDLTGNASYQGNWDLEIQKGDIDATPLEGSPALKDLTGVLQVTFPMSLGQVVSYGSYAGSANNAQVHENGGTSYTLKIDGHSDGTFVNGTYVYLGGGGVSRESGVTLSLTGGQVFTPSSLSLYTSVASTFTFTTNLGGTVTRSLGTNNGATIDLSSLPSGVTTLTFTGSSNFSGWIDNVVFSAVTPLPAVSSVSVPSNSTFVAGQNLDFTVNINNNITVNTAGGTPQLSLTIGSTTRQAIYQSGSGTSALLFRYTVQTGDLDSDGIAVGTLSPNGSTLKDGLGIDMNTSLNNVGNTSLVRVDAVAPTVSNVSVPSNNTYGSGQNLNFTINANENVTVNTAGGTPQLSLTIGSTTRQAIYFSGTGSSALVFRYTVQSGEVDADGIVVGTLSTNGGTLKDGVGHDMNTTLNSVGSTSLVLVDGVAPTIGSVSVPSNGTYSPSQNLDFTINTNENVTVNTSGGTPQLSLTIGATAQQAAYVSGSGTNALVFRYTVQAGDLDMDGISIGTLSVNGGTLKDGAGNNMNTTLNSVGSTILVLVDGVAPTVNSVSVPSNGTYGSGQYLQFNINMSEVVWVDATGGTPQLSITVGSTTRQATYLSGSGNTALSFRYQVQPGDFDNDGITVGTLSANGGTLQDDAGNDLITALNNVGNMASVRVITNNAPTDIALSSTTINENVAANTSVGAFTSTDPDIGNTFTYTLVAGTGDTDNTSFNINGNSLRISNRPDFETKNSYNVRIRTTDQGSLSFEKQFTISINDVNEVNVATFSGIVDGQQICSNGSPITLTASNSTIGTFSGDGITGNANGTATFSPVSQGAGSHGIMYTVVTEAAPVFVKIAAAWGHSLAIKSDGTLWAWGSNSKGELGDGTTIDAIPKQIDAANNWTSVTVGTEYSLAIKSDGTLWAWGANDRGQLGDGTTIDRSLPVQIGTDMNWSLVSAKGSATLAIKTDGTLWAWGDNTYGQLGDGTNTEKHIPVQIGTATNWSYISSGYFHSTAIKSDGTLWAWGANDRGQLGDGTTNFKNVPQQVGTASNWSQISAGLNCSLAIKTDGTLWAWGANNSGKLGDGTTTDRSTPVRIGGATNWSGVGTGTYHTVASQSDGTLWAWGQNANGQLGDGTRTDRYDPVQIGTSFTAQESAGYNVSVAIKADGTLWGLGDGEINDGTVSDATLPSKLSILNVETKNITILSAPTADAPSNVVASDSYTLPALGAGNYYSGVGGTGTAYSAGNAITTSLTMHVYAQTGTTPNCTVDNSFTITINHTPTDMALSAAAVNENVPANAPIGTLSTTDADGGTFTYTLVPGTGDTDNALFTMSGNSLQINNSPDFETKSSYSVRIRTTDQGSLTFEKQFTISINDLDEVPPVVSNIVVSGSPMANDPSVSFTVTFSESVTGVAAGDFLVNGAGVTGSITGISGSGTSYTVTVASLSGTGTLTVDLNSSGTGITDGSGNAISGGFTSGATHAVDTQAPTVVISSTATSLTNSNPIPVTVTFSESVSGFTSSDLSVSGGTVSNFSGSGASYSFDLTPGSDGTLTVDVSSSVATDVANNGNTPASQFSITYDGTNPTVVINSATASPTNSNTIPVTVTFSESVSGFTSSDLTVTGGTVSNFSGSGTSYSFDLTPSSDGTLTVDVSSSVATDAANNGNTSASQFSITYDGTSPTVVISSVTASPTNSNTIPVTVTFSESVTGFTSSDLSVSGGTINNFSGSGTSYSFDLTPGSDGTLTVDVSSSVATDAANNGNTSASQFSITYDGTSPTVVINSATASPANNNPIPVTVTFSESVSGFTSSDLSVTGGTVSNFSGSGTSYSFDLAPGSDGTLTVDVSSSVATDAANNGNTSASQFSITYDGTSPTVVINSATASPTNSNTIPVTVTFSESVTGFTSSDLSVAGGTASNFSGSGTSYSFDLTPGSDGTLTVDVSSSVATDAANNGNTSASQFSITYDGTSPTVVINSATASPTNSNTIPVTVTFSESVSGFTSSDLSVSGGTVSNFSGSGTAYTFNLIPTSDGTVTVNVSASAATDAAGNGNTSASQFSITYNATSPTITITSTATSPTNVNPIPVTVIFSKPVTGFTSADVNVAGGTVSSFTGSGTSYTFTVTPTSDGVITIDIPSSVATDVAGNENLAASQFSIRYDGTASSGFSVTFIDAAVNSLNESQVAFQIVDGEIGSTYYYSIKNTDPATAGDVSATGTLSASPQILTADLSSLANGTLQLSITLTDGVGNTSSAVIDQIVKSSGVAHREIPQGFSPNGDGVEDEWVIPGIDQYPNNEVKIFNRYGQLVWQTKGYDNATNSWNSNSNASNVFGSAGLPGGTYFYVIDLGDQKTASRSGYVIIKR